MSLKGLIGGLIGGAIGAGIWAFVSYQFDREIGWIAWIVGILVGMGYRVGSGGLTDSLDGATAALVAALAIAGGKYISFSMFTDDIGGLLSTAEEQALVCLAYELAYEEAADGRALDWPRPQDAWGDQLRDYPERIRDGAHAWWGSLPPEQQQELREFPFFANLDYVTSCIADDIAEEWSRRGREIDWPPMTIVPDSYPQRRADYPEDLWTEAEDRWERMPTEMQEAYIRRMKMDYADVMTDIDQATDQIRRQGFLATYSLYDVLWAIFAVMSAYGLTAGWD
jgi:hypothetical protein